MLKPCDENCKTCLDVNKNGYLTENDSRCFYNLESFDLHPSVSISRFERIFDAQAAANIKLELKHCREKFYFCGDELDIGINVMQTRARAREICVPAKKESESTPWIRDARAIVEELNEFFRTNRLTDFFKNRGLIRKIQLTDKSIQKALESKREGGKKPYADKTAEALRNSCQLEVKDNVGILRKNAMFVETKMVEPIVIPATFLELILRKLHGASGCTSLAAYKKIVKCDFWAAGMHKIIEKVHRSCTGCTYYRKHSKIEVIPQEYDDTAPTELGQVFFSDVITRNTHGMKENHAEPTFKFYVVSEAVSGLCKIYPISNKDNNGEVGTDVILQALGDFARGPLKEKKIRVFVDGCSVNKNIAKRLVWNEFEVKIILPVAFSKSKNYVSPIDSRIGKITKYLVAEISKKGSPTRIAVATSNRANCTPGRHGFTPYEIYYERDRYNKKITVDLEKLIKYIKECREKGRQAQLRNQAKGRTRRPLKLTPFEEGDSYESEFEKPIKLGDLILIEGDWNKNDLNPYFKVVATDAYPSGVDWFEGVVYTHKLGVSRKHVHVWSLTAIRAIVDGREAGDVENAGLMMVAHNDELVLPEFMHSRTQVFNRELWSKPLISYKRLIARK